MSQNPYLPRFKDQAASVPAERRRSLSNRDPDGTLLAAQDATLLAAKSHKVSTDRQAKTEESHRNSNDNVRAPPSSAAEATATLMAFDVVAVEDTTTGDPLAFAVVDDEECIVDDEEGISVGTSVGTSNNDNNIVPNINNNNNDIVPNINKNNRNVTAAPSQSNHVHAPKSFPSNTAIVAVAVAVVVFVIAAIARVVVGVVCGGGGCGSTSDPSATTSPRSQDITNFINSKSYMGVDLSPTGTSPEELALQWLIQDDPLQLNVGAQDDEFRLLQRYSLLTFWFQAGTGTTWRSSTNWRTADECTWYGITCQSGVVTVVDFNPFDDDYDGNGIQGTLSPDLGLLTDLTMFDISPNNALTGSLPSEIGLWTNLQEFDVAFNALTGSLPSEIGLWTNLEWFHVGWNALTGSLPSEIFLWTNLLKVHLGSNALTGSLPSEIGLWTYMESFSVWGNDLTGSLPSEIGLWTNLQEFDVYMNTLTGTIPATIANWKLIEYASFYNNNFSGSMPNGICEFITGTDNLWADCDEVPCSCCTKCW